MISYIETEYMQDFARVNLDTGGYLQVTPDENYVCLNGEMEFTDEDIKDCIFMIGGKYYTAQQVLQQVGANWDSALAEQAQEVADELAHVERYSNVKGSGRI